MRSWIGWTTPGSSFSSCRVRGQIVLPRQRMHDATECDSEVEFGAMESPFGCKVPWVVRPTYLEPALLNECICAAHASAFYLPVQIICRQQPCHTKTPNPEGKATVLDKSQSLPVRIEAYKWPTSTGDRSTSTLSTARQVGVAMLNWASGHDGAILTPCEK